MTHGTRIAYQAGCRETCCRRANAAYQAELRKDRARGILRPRMKVPVLDVRKTIKAMKADWVTGAHLAKALGLKNRSLRLHPTRITVQKLGQLKMVFDAYMAEGPDEPISPSMGA